MSTDMDKNRTASGMRRWIKVVFALSLSLNFLIVAAFGAMAWRWGGDDKYSRGHPQGEAFMLIRALPEASRRQLRTRFERERPHPHVDRKQQTEALIVLLQSAPFDPEAFENQLNTQVRGCGDRMQRGAAAISAVIADMSEAERVTYAQEVQRLSLRRRQLR